MEHSRKTYTRRGVLALGGAAVVSTALRQLFPRRDEEAANDFPVASYHPPGGPVDVASWRLEVVGAVGKPLSLPYEELLRLPRARQSYALSCITGWTTVQEWEGVPISSLLELAVPLAKEPGIKLTAADNYSLTLEPAQYGVDGALVVTHVSGAPLSHDHGFPARLMMPDVIGVQNAKWLSRIEVLTV